MRTTGKARPRVPLALAPDAAGRLGWRLAELAAATGIAVSTLSDAVRTGRLGAVRIGPRALFVPAEAWRAFLAANAVQPRQRPASPPSVPETARHATACPARPRRVSAAVSQVSPGARR